MEYHFDAFRIDADSRTLFRDAEPLSVGKRAVALLLQLVMQPGAPVSKDALIDAAWAGLLVEESNLPVQIAALRKALGASPGGAGWIETLPRRGYRFVGPAVTTVANGRAAARPGNGVASAASTAPPEESRARRTTERHRWIVGRQEALSTLDAAAQKYLAGEHKALFVTGEAGIGKTAFVELGTDRLRKLGMDILTGRCIERFGGDEAFIPLIDALAARCREDDAGHVVEALWRHAPTWLMHIPELVTEKDRPALRNEVFGATRERMIREFSDLVSSLARKRPIALVLEDLHWSDHATLDVLSRVAGGDRYGSVFLLGTYRTADTLTSDHPIHRLHKTLDIQRRCGELKLARLTDRDVEEHLALRFQSDTLARDIGIAMYGRTNGQPLFIRSLLDCLIDQQAIVEIDGRWRLDSKAALFEGLVPDNLTRMIGHQIDHLEMSDRILLETASVAGTEFGAPLVAAALGAAPDAVERALETLARKGIALSRTGEIEWPDGAFSGLYSFDHILYQNVLYARLAPGSRVQIHARMGARMEAAYGDRAGEVASALASHFEQGRDVSRALRYLTIAAENSTRRLGHTEAASYLSRALALIDRTDGVDLPSLRISLLRQRSMSYRSSGNLAEAVADLRALVHCAEESGQTPVAVAGLLTLSRFCIQVDRRVCMEAADAVMRKCAALEDESVRALAEGSTASINLYLKGWRDQDAALCERALAVTVDARDHGTLMRRYGIEGILECSKSRYRECRISAVKGKVLAREVGDVYVFVILNLMEAVARLHLGEWREMKEETLFALDFTERNVNRPARALCRLTLAWLHVEAMDFDGGERLCLDVDQDILDEYSFAFVFQKAVLAKAFVGQGRLDSAKRHLDDVEARLESDGSGLDFTIATQFYYCLADYWLRVGDFVRARVWATTLHDYTCGAPDRNHLALSYALFARIESGEGRPQAAQDYLSRARATIGGDFLPLAGWRIHQSAAEIHAGIGDRAKAEREYRHAALVLQGLAGNFASDDSLRRSLLSAADALPG